MAEQRASVPDRRLWLLMGGTVLTLFMAALVKGPCLSQPWDGSQYRDLCYNDLQPLYSLRSLDEKVIPYVGAPGLNADQTPKGFLEYPVLTGLFVFLAAVPASTAEEFFVWNALILSSFAIGTTVVLYRTVRDSRRVAFFAAGPPLILYAFHNWDLIAVFFATLGLHAFNRGRWTLSGVCLGCGAAAKIYPAFFVPVLGLALLRDEVPKFGRSARLVGSAAATFLILNLPFALTNPNLWWQTYAFHLSRGATFESPWFALTEYAQRLGVAQLGFEEARMLHAAVAIPLFLVFSCLIGWRVWARRLSPGPGCLAILLVFLLLNKVWSVQYLLWVLPFFTLLPLSWKKFAAVEAADVFVYATVFPYLLHAGGAMGETYFDRLALEVGARTAFLAWLLASCLMKGGTMSVAPAPAAASQGAPEAVPPV